MRTYYNGIQVETSGVRSISGGGTNASTASQALANLGAYPSTNPSGFATNTSVASLSGTLTGNYIQGNGAITNIVSLTQAQFNLISVPSPNTVYLIIG